MTAPDPGLTDLIAAHRLHTGLRTQCECGINVSHEDWPAHVALVVEQHTNERIAEKDRLLIGWRDHANAQQERAEKAEATIARVREIRCGVCGNPLSEGSGNCASDAGRPHVYDEADLRAALEGEADADPT
ncbi:hypothetical protein [Rhodococcus sp. (in: high G+C Gram-positive bacteria)]|uniref:hypothetical protein n=1 Tax=Rhodococcus sp. TaxID=1831 RepID=UPI001A20718C|nr:hypothetical protein [Rhodococcus sp. (in: high G+C Gram-positive bacteria)]MBJ7479243.1 hypothetical protein [Rhodococcus sp. (in: high G+C Gram-positive bacteria)]